MTSSTLAIIKPDAYPKKKEIPELIERASFIIADKKEVTLTLEQAEDFYAAHKEKPFFSDLCEFMSSGPCVVLRLKQEDSYAVPRWRIFIGDTDPAKAFSTTLRHRFGTSIDNNALHGSDSDENAATELEFFFG